MFFDVNLSIGSWPFRRLQFDRDPHTFFRWLTERGIRRGVVRHAGSPFRMDLETVNQELGQTVGSGFIPAFTVHPDYGFWRMIRCRAAVLFPAFHNYSLTAEHTLEMAGHLVRQGTVLHIVVREEDERNQHPRCLVPAVSPAEIAAFSDRLPDAVIVLLNASRTEILQLKNHPRIYTDIAFYEPFNPDPELIPNLLFGSHAPFFYPLAAIRKTEMIAHEDWKHRISSAAAERIYGLSV